MRYHLTFLALVCTLATPTISAKTMDDQFLSISARCRDNPSCVFTGADILVDISVTNVSGGTVGYPVEYVQRRGPTVRLVDKATGAERHLKTSLANRALMRQFTDIAPGQSLTLSTVIKGSEVGTFRQERIDLTAEIGGSATIRINSNDERAFKGTTVLRIIGKDTYEEEQRSR